MVNVVAQHTRVGDYLREVRRPALHLLGLYALQVSASCVCVLLWWGCWDEALGSRFPDMCLYYWLQGLLTFGYILLLSRVGEKVAGNMRKELFGSLIRYQAKGLLAMIAARWGISASRACLQTPVGKSRGVSDLILQSFS